MNFKLWLSMKEVTKLEYPTLPWAFEFDNHWKYFKSNNFIEQIIFLPTFLYRTLFQKGYKS